MRKSIVATMAVLALLFIGEAQAKPKNKTHFPVEGMTFTPTGIGPLEASVAYGEMSKGPYGVFLKFPGNFTSPVHTHTGDYRAVVIEGTLVNSEENEEDITMRPGSYWFQRGKVKHTTKCVSESGCKVFLTQTGKFDFLTK